MGWISVLAAVAAAAAWSGPASASADAVSRVSPRTWPSLTNEWASQGVRGKRLNQSAGSVASPSSSGPSSFGVAATPSRNNNNNNKVER